jgi:hypothetical protein
MRRATPRGIWALRAVTVTLSIIVILVVGTVVYSAYKDFSTIRSELASGSNQVQRGVVQSGNSAVASLNITVSNSGLYTLDVTLNCDRSNPNVVCTAAHVSVPAGEQGVLRFKMTILSIQQYQASGNRRINGTVSAALEPFASITVVTDLSGLVKLVGP